MNFLNALERIPKLVEQYKAQNVTYERDIPILQETVGGTWKKEDELKALKAEVAALERKIQLTLAPPKPEAGQEQAAEVQSGSIKVQSQTSEVLAGNAVDSGENVINGISSDRSDVSQFIREHIQFVRLKPVNDNPIQGKKVKL